MKLKKRLETTLAGLAVVFMASSALAEETITLRVADSFPAKHYVAKFINTWMENVTKLTNGQVQFKYFGAQQLGKAKDMLSLTNSGVADIAYVAPSYISEKMPLSAVAELPGNFDNSCHGTRAYWKLSRGDGFLAKNEFQPNDVRLVFSVLGAPYQILSTKEFEKPGDLAGMKLRSYSSPQDTAAKKLDAVPIRIPAPEMYESISRGTIDGAILPLASVFSYKLDELVKYATTDMNFGSVALNYVMNADKFDSLPKNVQEAILKAGDQSVDTACAKIDSDTKEAIGKLEKAGITLVQFDDAERTRVINMLKDIGPAWAKGADERGQQGSEALKAYNEALESTK